MSRTHFVIFSSVCSLAAIMLKLCGVTSCSWVLVTAPIWGPIAFVAVFFLYLLFSVILDVIVEVALKGQD